MNDWTVSKTRMKITHAWRIKRKEISESLPVCRWMYVFRAHTHTTRWKRAKSKFDAFQSFSLLQWCAVYQTVEWAVCARISQYVCVRVLVCLCALCVRYSYVRVQMYPQNINTYLYMCMQAKYMLYGYVLFPFCFDFSLALVSHTPNPISIL